MNRTRTRIRTCSEECNIKEFIKQIDSVIHNLSDSIHTLRSSVSANTRSESKHTSKRRKLTSRGDKNDSGNGVGVGNDIGNWKFGSNENEDDDSKMDPPVGLERQYNELYALLRRGLLGPDESQKVSFGSSGSNNTITTDKRNVSALLLGPRGQGKSLVLERCLMSLIREKKNRNSHGNGNGHDVNDNGIEEKENKNEKIQSQSHSLVVPFRVVRLNGILLRGHDVNVTVREIVRQLSEIASRESYERLRLRSMSVSTSDSISHQKEVSSETTMTESKNVKTQIVQTMGTGSSSTGTGTSISKKMNTASVGVGVINDENLLKVYKILENESHNLRTRRTTFNNSLAILDEALKTACIDSIPILIVMDELDSFLNTSSGGTNASSSTGGTNSQGNQGSNNVGRRGGHSSSAATDISSKRHLLLYHLLDRVAGSGSLISLVSSASRLSTIGMFEKRVKSRADGTTKVIYFGRPSSYEVLVSILLSQIDDSIHDNVHDNTRDTEKKEPSSETIPSLSSFKEQVRGILSPSESDVGEHMNSDERQRSRDKLFMVKDILERNFIIGQDVRWFFRVMSISLSLYVEDLNLGDSTNNFTEEIYDESRTGTRTSNKDTTNSNSYISLPKFKATYFEEALMAMGGTNVNSKTIKVTSEDIDKDEAEMMRANPRIRGLIDLAGPQIAVLLSAKRIISRDGQNEVSMKPLTFERILNEYESYFIAQSKATGPDKYSQHIFFRSFCDLLGGFFIPAKDHTGGGPLQYYYGSSYTTEKKLTLQRIPLHVNVDLEGELGEALKRNMLDCTSALRDWGIASTGC